MFKVELRAEITQVTCSREQTGMRAVSRERSPILTCVTQVESIQCPELLRESVLSSLFSAVTQISARHRNHQGNIKKQSVIYPSYALERAFDREE